LYSRHPLEGVAVHCFNHPDIGAIGVCKACTKGICMACVTDTGRGIACSPSCVEGVNSLHAFFNKNKQMFSIAAKNHLRSAIWLVLLAAGFIIFGFWIEGDTPFRAYLVGMGVLFLVGAAFALLNSRKMARMAKTDAADPSLQSAK
jgi:hypothetical protein